MTEKIWLLERVGPAAVVQLYADAFATLSPRDRQLAWHLYEAALCGRDIYYDQRYEHGLLMRDLLETLFVHRARLEPLVAQAIERYTKLFWINSGTYDHITSRKFVLALTRGQLIEAIRAVQGSAPSCRSVRMPPPTPSRRRTGATSSTSRTARW